MDSDLASRPVLVLDFGAQYVQLIARRVRERHAFARIVRHDITAARVRELNPLAVILSGGPASVYEPGAPHCDPAIFDLGIPILGICYGMQLICETMGTQVQANPSRGEFGRTECRVLDAKEPLFHDVPRETIVWMSHGDQIQNAGGDFLGLAATPSCPIAAVRHRERPIYGLQFHPEVSHTPYGSLVLGNFLDRICSNPRSWTMGAFIERPWPRSRAGSARTIGSSAASPAESIRRSARRCWPGHWDPASSASSSTPACFAAANATRSPTRSARGPTPSCGWSTPPSRSSRPLRG